VTNHYDSRDPTSVSPTTRSRIAETTRSASNSRKPRLRIGVPLEYNTVELSPTIRSAWQRSLRHLQTLGHSIHPVSLPATKQALSAYYVLAPAEASSNLAKYDGVRYGVRDPDTPDNAGGYLYSQTRDSGFGAEVKRRILLGTFTLSADAINNYFIQAQKVRRLVQNDFNEAFRLQNPLLPLASSDINAEGSEGVDVLVCPTAPTLPPTMRSLEDAPPVQQYVSDVLTVPASLAGLPALSVPVPMTDNSSQDSGVNSVGMQVIGQHGDDELVLHVGELLEGMTR
jgi:aspartyl-tRNA(Asn)/glutamyl-tRNA(Gln) amidotransferase subunit A